MAVRDPHLASPYLLGNRPIPTRARVAALDCLIEDIGTSLTPTYADMLIDYVAERFERGEIEGALATLTSFACDLTGAYRIAAVMHTEET